MILISLFIIGIVYLAYTDWKNRELFMPVLWVLTPILVFISLTTSLQSFLSLFVALAVTFVLFMHYRLGYGDRISFIVITWLIGTMLGNTYQIYLTIPCIIGLFTLIAYKAYPQRQMCEIKKIENLIQGDIILEKYTRMPKHCLVYRGKPFVFLTVIASVMGYFVGLLFSIYGIAGF